MHTTIDRLVKPSTVQRLSAPLGSVATAVVLIMGRSSAADAQFFPGQNMLKMGGIAFDQVNSITTSPAGNIYVTGTFMGDGALMGYNVVWPVFGFDWNRDIPPKPGVVDTTALPFDTYQRAAFIAKYNAVGMLERLVTIGCLDGAEGTGIAVTINACTGEEIIYATGYYNGPVRIATNGGQDYWYPSNTVDKGVDGPKSPYLIQILPDGKMWVRFSIKGDTDDPSMKGLGMSLRSLPFSLPCDHPFANLDFNKIYVYGDYQDYAGFVAKFDNTDPLNRQWTKGLGKIKGLGQDDHGETAGGEFYQYGIKVNGAAPGSSDDGDPKVFVTGTVVGNQPLTQRSAASDLHEVVGGEKGFQWVAEIDDDDSDVGWYRQLFAGYPTRPFWTQVEIDTDKRLFKDTLVAPYAGQTIMDLGRGYQLELSAAPQFVSGKLIGYDTDGITVGGDYAGDILDRNTLRGESGTPFSGAYLARYTKRGDLVWLRTIQGGSQLDPARRDSTDGHLIDYSQDPGVTAGALTTASSFTPLDPMPRLFIAGQVHGFNTNGGFGGNTFAAPFTGESNGDVFATGYRQDGSPVWEYTTGGFGFTRGVRGIDRQDEAHALHFYGNGALTYSPYQGIYIGGSFDSLTAFNNGPVLRATPGIPGMSIRLRKYQDTVFDQDEFGHVIGSRDVTLATLDTIYTLSHQDGYIVRDDTKFPPPPGAPATVMVKLDTTAADPTGSGSARVSLSIPVALPSELAPVDPTDAANFPRNPFTGLLERPVGGYVVTRHARTSAASNADGRQFSVHRPGAIRPGSGVGQRTLQLREQIKAFGYVEAVRRQVGGAPLPPATMRFLAREDSVRVLQRGGLSSAITGQDEPAVRGPNVSDMRPPGFVIPGLRQGTRYAVGDLVREADPRTMKGRLQTYGDGTLLDARVMAILHATTADSTAHFIDSLPRGTTAADWGYRVYLFMGNPEPVMVTDTLATAPDSVGVVRPPVDALRYVVNRRTTGHTPYFSAEHLVGSTSGSVVTGGTTRPVRNHLYSASPNPFNPTTLLRFDLSEADPTTSVSIYNMLGQLVQRIQTEGVIGTNQVRFNGSSLPSGVYIYRVDSGLFSAARRFTLVK